ncbi:methyltransferase domain-containing protein [Candidatus Woesearchaeota archaeon]|nr:methyltransferase domain-containing protein [Candidatus Woesearchaeota archaeon]
MASTQERYNRIAPLYDFFEAGGEILLFRKWRKAFFSNLDGKILDVGVGTGKNIPYYHQNAEVIGIDFAQNMLERAKQRLQKEGRKNVTLLQMDVEHLEFPENTFDYVITSCVFCSVPNPVNGLKEINRVLKPTGKLIMIEHVLSKHTLIAWCEYLHNPITKRLFGAEIVRDTKTNIFRAGLNLEEDKNLALFDVFRLFVAKKSGSEKDKPVRNMP